MTYLKARLYINVIFPHPLEEPHNKPVLFGDICMSYHRLLHIPADLQQLEVINVKHVQMLFGPVLNDVTDPTLTAAVINFKIYFLQCRRQTIKINTVELD